MLKRFQMVCFKGSTQVKSFSEIFRFDYGKAINDPAAAGVPDPAGSGLLFVVLPEDGETIRRRKAHH
jgi:hypothetical protein